MMTEFEAELTRRLAEPVDDAPIDISRSVAAILQRDARAQRRRALAAAGTCTILTALAIVAGFGIASHSLPQWPPELAEVSPLWLPFALLAAVLTVSGGTIAASLMRPAR